MRVSADERQALAAAGSVPGGGGGGGGGGGSDSDNAVGQLRELRLETIAKDARLQVTTLSPKP